MLKLGQPAPPFTLKDDQGRAVTLDHLRADGPFVLYFYPADFTPVCTAQACMFRDRYAELAAAGVRVFGVSPQGPDTHAKFKGSLKLPFPLLADEDKSVIRAYGARGPLGIGVRRVSYFIGADATIRDVELADWRVSRHRGFVDRVLAASPTAGC